jgi:fructose-1,6-bisphosphatase/inositol monophosphatase family enzyme
MGSLDARRFLEVMLLAVRQAGAVALRLQGEVPAREKQGHGSPEAAAVSAADLACQDVLLMALHEALPHAALLAEEDTEAVTLFPPPANDRPLAVIDPIDGSLQYLERSADYAVMAGWIEGGRYRAAVVTFPAWEQTWWGLRGEGVWHQGPHARPARVRISEVLPPVVLVPPRLPGEVLAALAATGLEPRVTRCSAVDGTAPLTGRGRASWLTGNPGRARAIGWFLVHEAGGHVLLGGRPWSGEDPAAAEVTGPSLTAADAATADLLLQAGAAPRVWG